MLPNKSVVVLTTALLIVASIGLLSLGGNRQLTAGAFADYFGMKDRPSAITEASLVFIEPLPGFDPSTMEALRNALPIESADQLASIEALSSEQAFLLEALFDFQGQDTAAEAWEALPDRIDELEEQNEDLEDITDELQRKVEELEALVTELTERLEWVEEHPLDTP